MALSNHDNESLYLSLWQIWAGYRRTGTVVIIDSQTGKIKEKIEISNHDNDSLYIFLFDRYGQGTDVLVQL
jgi:hypothetical protein